MTFRYFFTLCLLWSTAWGLLGCGGGSDSKTAGTGGSSATSPVLAGVYYYRIYVDRTLSWHDFWGVITPGNRWYGLNELSNGYDIYSGTISGVGRLNATVPALKYQNNAANNLNLTTGTADFTSSGQGKLTVNLNLISNVSIDPVSFTDATATHGFTNTPTASLGDVAGTWSGDLSFGSGVTPSFTVNIDATSGLISAPGFYSNSCSFSSSTSSATTIANANLFTLTLNTNSVTGCPSTLNNKTFNGVAFVTNQHLIWVATDPDGYAIAFNATRH